MAEAISKFVRLGYKVSIPFGGDYPYDLLIDDDNSILRVQCKHGRLRNGCVVFNTASVVKTVEGYEQRGYKGLADMFFVYAPDIDRTFLIPVGETTKGYGYLRIVDKKLKTGPPGMRGEPYEI